MKFHRVEGKLPVGVVPCISMLAGFNRDLSDFQFATRRERITSTEPTKITLDVPEAAAAETARVLRAMADELVGEKR